MEWLEWAATDAAIRAEFGYRPEDDLATARLLRPLVPPANRLRLLLPLVQGRRDVAIVGCGPSLEAAEASTLRDRPVVAADGATTWLRENGIVPAVVVTDLDGAPDDLVWAARAGAAMVVHAHGDNAEAVRDLAPLLVPRLFGTYQGPPAPGLAPLANLGGFTDGDRAVVLCEHLGARQASLTGFDYDSPPSRYSHRWDPHTKPRKLQWARRVVDGVRSRGRLRLGS